MTPYQMQMKAAKLYDAAGRETDPNKRNELEAEADALMGMAEEMAENQDLDEIMDELSFDDDYDTDYIDDPFNDGDEIHRR